jgi:hypothetical protein
MPPYQYMHLPSVTRIKAGTLSLIGPESDDDLIFTATRIIDNVYLLDLASDKATVSEPQIVQAKIYLVKPVSKNIIYKRLEYVGFNRISCVFKIVDGLVLDYK